MTIDSTHPFFNDDEPFNLPAHASDEQIIRAVIVMAEAYVDHETERITQMAATLMTLDLNQLKHTWQRFKHTRTTEAEAFEHLIHHVLGCLERTDESRLNEY